MAQKVTLEAITRAETTIAQIRQDGFVPAELYGHGVENKSVQVDSKKFARAFEMSGSTTLVDLVIEGETYNVLVRDIQLHPLRGTVQHIDFYQVRLDEEVTADVSLLIEGESPAVKNMGGILVRNMDTISVEALPQNLPHDISVDISGLASFDDVITVADLTLPGEVKVLDDAEEVVVLVQAPRTEAELESLSEEVSEDVESVEGVADKKEDDDETQGEDAERESSDAKE